MKRRRLLLAWLVATVLGWFCTGPMAAHIPQMALVDGAVVPTRWAASSFPIVWQMHPAIGSNVTGSREQSEVFAASFEEWDEIATADIEFSQGTVAGANAEPAVFDGVNLISTDITPSEFEDLGVSGAIGVTFNFLTSDGEIVESDITFNPDTSFSTDEVAPGDRIDLQSVATHEIGHLLGLDHSNLLSSTMFPTIVGGATIPRETKPDDQIGISTMYPAAGFHSSTGALSGSVRTTSHAAVFGALVVVLGADGQAIITTFTDPTGAFSIQGLPPGSYALYAEPMNRPFTESNLGLEDSFPGESVNSNFTVRFR